MADLILSGQIIAILPEVTGTSKTGKAWNKQDFVIETNEQFPKKVCFTLFGDKTSLINGIAEGSEIDVHFNLESRDFNGKWYHNINCWKIEVKNSGSQTTGSPNNYQTSATHGSGLPPTEYATQEQQPEEVDNDLPF